MKLYICYVLLIASLIKILFNIKEAWIDSPYGKLMPLNILLWSLLYSLWKKSRIDGKSYSNNQADMVVIISILLCLLGLAMDLNALLYFGITYFFVFNGIINWVAYVIFGLSLTWMPIGGYILARFDIPLEVGSIVMGSALILACSGFAIKRHEIVRV